MHTWNSVAMQGFAMMFVPVLESLPAGFSGKSSLLGLEQFS